MISRSIHDVIAEPRRQKLIPEFYQAKRAALSNGALGFSISGAGPSVFALCEGESIARKVGRPFYVFSSIGLENQQHISHQPKRSARGRGKIRTFENSRSRMQPA